MKMVTILVLLLISSHSIVSSPTCNVVNSVWDLSNTGITGTIDNSTLSACNGSYGLIEKLDLSYNSITGIDRYTFAIFYKLLNLSISHNSITHIHKDTFNSLIDIKYIDASFNSLTRLEAGLFDLFNVETINLQNNNISSVEPGIVSLTNENLKYFNLNNNSLIVLEPWPYLTKITDDRSIDRVFDLQYNLITNITNTMNWTHNLKHPFQVNVNLQNNFIQGIGLGAMRKLLPDIELESMVTVFITMNINITHNPFICDCNVYDFAYRLRDSVYRWAQIDSYRYRCNRDEIDWLHDIELELLVCNRTDDCPPGCFCQDRPHNDTFYINCQGAGLTEMPATIPAHNRSKIEIFLDNNDIQTLNATSYMAQIYNLSINHNKLERLDPDIVKSLNVKKIDLRHNRIATIPKEIQRFNYDSVLLAGNPLQCDCNSLWISDWMKLYQENGDLSLMCHSDEGDHTLIDLSLEELKCINTDLITIGVIAGVFAVIFVVVMVFVKRCPYETKVILHKLFQIHPGDKYKVDNDKAKEVDIYLIFDADDDDVVGWTAGYFLGKLQSKKPLYSVLNPCRFTEGGSEAQNQDKWIAKSKRVIVVLSENLFRNEWTINAVNIAETCLIESKTHQNSYKHTDNTEEEDANSIEEAIETAGSIIYILFNKSEKLQAILEQEPWKSRLTGKTVLKYGERLFWSKLRYELPLKGNGTGTDGNFLPQRETDYRQRGNAAFVVDENAFRGDINEGERMRKDKIFNMAKLNNRAEGVNDILKTLRQEVIPETRNVEYIPSETNKSSTLSKQRHSIVHKRSTNKEQGERGSSDSLNSKLTTITTSFQTMHHERMVNPNVLKDLVDTNKAKSHDARLTEIDISEI